MTFQGDHAPASRTGRSSQRLRHAVVAPFAALAAIAGLLAIAPTAAEAQIDSGFVDHCWIVADGSGGTAADWLSEYDLVTDAETPAGNGTGTDFVEAIAFHYPTGQLFATNAGQFGVIDLTPGSTFGTFSPIGPGGLGDVDGLAFDSTTGHLWGSVRLNGNNDQLIRIDFNTGTQVGATVTVATTVYSGPLSPTPTNLLDIDDMAIDPVTGNFYAIANGAGLLDMLVIIDPVTGATTPVGSPADSGVQDIEGLGFTPAGDLIGTSGSGGGPVANSIVDINLNDGSASLRNDMLTYIDHEAVDCLTNAYLDPGISLEKDTNGDDADSPTGPYVDTATGTVTWTYEITNTGNLALFDLTLSDDIEGAVTCSHPQPLLPGDSTTCTLTRYEASASTLWHILAARRTSIASGHSSTMWRREAGTSCSISTPRISPPTARCSTPCPFRTSSITWPACPPSTASIRNRSSVCSNGWRPMSAVG